MNFNWIMDPCFDRRMYVDSKRAPRGDRSLNYAVGLDVPYEMYDKISNAVLGKIIVNYRSDLPIEVGANLFIFFLVPPQYPYDRQGSLTSNA